MKPTEHPHRFWARYPVPTLFGSLAPRWLTVRQLGGSDPVVAVVVFASAAALVPLIVHPYRTEAGAVASVLVLGRVAAIGFFGTDAVSRTAPAGDGKRTLAQVTDVRPKEGRSAGHCLLRTAEGQEIPRRLSPCEGRQVGNRPEVTYDPAGSTRPRRCPTRATRCGGPWA
ncbi:hypothetical protein [Kitasatospora sp. CB02891]|uniref:hypothetical protein n=1 Tax=Kitasatospora sp. CB02891 TaxID=2020329 RepID=UPI000C27F861|nr:hypothetical protein [Kitasatospora sp. CB02891]PJN21903.1 hypothetical protein CG736_30730 [Kitasatospora sp. CB02891]